MLSTVAEREDYFTPQKGVENTKACSHPPRTGAPHRAACPVGACEDYQHAHRRREPTVTTDAPGPPVVRGQNPVPEDGWTWYLTDYEIEYIRAYNVRPPRTESWSGTAEAEYRLEQEADGVRQARQPRNPSWRQWGRRRVRRSWPWVTLAALLVACSVTLGAAGFQGLNEAQSVAQKTHNVKEAIANG